MIALDVSAVREGRTGVGTYAEHLALALASLDLPIALLTNRPEELPESLSRLNVLATPGWPAQPTLAWLQLTAPRIVRSAAADLTHYTTGRAPLVGSRPFILTVHDVLPVENPRFQPARDRVLVTPWLARSIERAAAIIAVSEDTACAIARCFPRLDAQVHVVHEGVAAPWFEPVPDSESRRILSQCGLGERFWLHVGAHGPRKNLTRLIKAFAIARGRSTGQPPQLVLAGPDGHEGAELRASIQRGGLVVGRDVIVTGYVSMSALRALMARAEMCVFPSLHEGFGLPVVEAMAAGTPCVVSHRGALPETSGGAAIQVDPLDTGEIARALDRLGRDGALRARLSEEGKARARDLSWERCARSTVVVYERQLSASRARKR